MADKVEISKLTCYIEENLRASIRTGLNFIDTRNHKQRLLSAQNHVIYGRRGAGKSSLLSSLDDNTSFITIKLNLEDYKDISFPNIIVHVLKECFECLHMNLKRQKRLWWLSPEKRKTLEKLKKQISDLEKQLYEPDEASENQRTKEIESGELTAKASNTGSFLEGKSKNEYEKEVSRSISTVKLDYLKKNIPFIKKLVNELSSEIGNKKIYLIFDDFYFIPKSIQPDFIDYFHRLTKDTSLFLKIATIRHRSKLYRQTAETYIGSETKHDIFEIDMDLTLDAFGDLQSFMKLLLDRAREASNSNIQIDSLFSGEGFFQLCLASGGVPRDFLSLFVTLANRIISGEINTIGKLDATEAAISDYSSKMASLKTDSVEEREILEQYLSIIKEYVYSKRRTNMFIVSKSELDEFQQERQAIRELVDLRLLHIVDSNTSSAPSDGRMYEAYMLDVSLYANSRPRNFKQIEPGTTDARSRKDDIRSSPRLNLKNLRVKYLEGSIKQLEISFD